MGTVLENINVENVGKGVLVDLPITPSACATTGTRTQAENSVPADVIVVDADGEDVIVGFQVPRDYDGNEDHLKVVITATYVSGTSIDLQGSAVSRGRSGTAWADESDFTAATATTISSDDHCVEVEADLSDLDWLAFDSVAVNFAASNRTSSGVAHVVSARIEYRSKIAANDFNDRD